MGVFCKTCELCNVDIIKMAKLLGIVLTIFFFVDCSMSIGFITRISTRPSECNNCGMTPLGQLSFKICGGVPEACCAVVDIANGDGMNEGTTYSFTGEHELLDCFNYSLTRVNTVDQLGLTVYHEGSDGAQMEWVEIETSDKRVIKCNLGQWLDGVDSVTIDTRTHCMMQG